MLIIEFNKERTHYIILIPHKKTKNIDGENNKTYNILKAREKIAG